ncbi:MAG: NCS2 family permease [Ruminococcaceae bacterium]|nr:NCS2 family permease [Oscillospiraceae bacterium]
MEQFFHLKEHRTSVRREFVAGLTAFMAMAYILIVNPSMFAAEFGSDYFDAVYISTSISAVVGTLMMGLFAKLPLSQAAGMGINAFFVNTVCHEFGFTYANALVLVLFDGILFLLLTATGLRKHILEAIPTSVKTAISAGIGLFIAFLGLQSAGLLEIGNGTISLHSFNIFPSLHGTATWAQVMPLLIAVIAIIAIGIISKKGVRGAVLWGIVGSAAVYYIVGLISVDGFADGISGSMSVNIFAPFEKFADLSLFAVFREGFDFSAFIEANGMGNFIIALLTTTISFCLVDMFDTLGALYGACTCGGLVKNDGSIPKLEKAMTADAVATCVGAVCGCSPVTTFVESAAGIAEGGKTGLTAVFTALLFFLAMFIAPIAKLIPACATAAALVYVGILMMGCVRDIDWDDPSAAVPAFLTVSMIPFTNNISFGIAFGMIASIAISVFTGKIRDVKLGTWLIGILFTVMFFVSK